MRGERDLSTMILGCAICALAGALACCLAAVAVGKEVSFLHFTCGVAIGLFIGADMGSERQ